MNRRRARHHPLGPEDRDLRGLGGRRLRQTQRAETRRPTTKVRETRCAKGRWCSRAHLSSLRPWGRLRGNNELCEACAAWGVAGPPRHQSLDQCQRPPAMQRRRVARATAEFGRINSRGGPTMDIGYFLKLMSDKTLRTCS